MKIEEQITEKKKTVDFDTREFTIEFLVKKYTDKLDKDENDIFVPEYQREFVWDEIRQSRLIESVTLGLPIPIIFLAEDKNGRLEIVDGSQRIRTLAAFLTNELSLTGLDKLTLLNGVKFEELPSSRKRKINNTAMRMIVLSDTANEEVRNDLFERINRGSDLLRNMEKRKGIYRGPFNDFIYDECAKNQTLIRLSPLHKSVKNRQEYEELVLRFFALGDQYPNFKTHQRGIGSLLDEYLDEMNKTFDDVEKRRRLSDFERMLTFVGKCFPHGFAKGSTHYVSRVYFEAISVGVHLALSVNPSLPTREVKISDWMKDPNFHSLVSVERKTHTPKQMQARIEYVKDHLLNQ
ncbi:MAG: DUF262 domain-containing protein [Janthinobacterium lividum]